MNDKRANRHVDKTDAGTPDLIEVAKHEAEDRAGGGRSDPAIAELAAAEASALTPGTSASDARTLDPRQAGDFPDANDEDGAKTPTTKPRSADRSATD